MALMVEFKQYRRRELAELTPWVEDTNMKKVSVAEVDRLNGSPKEGDMIARNPKNHDDQWLVAKQYFQDNFDSLEWPMNKPVPPDIVVLVEGQTKAQKSTIVMLSMSTAINYRCVVASYRVVDGDTVWTELDLGFNVFIKQFCRVVGVDAPEHTTVAGQLVTQVVGLWVAAHAPLFAVSVGVDKYGGRYDGLLWDNQQSITLNQYLLEQGLARAYAGEKKPPWTQSELTAIEAVANKLLTM